MTTRVRTHYETKARPALAKELGVTNVLALPRLVKVVVNVGFGKVTKDPVVQQTAVATLERITGQKPVLTKAKQSIASFKLRQGMVIGAKVTLRGARAEEFVDKLIHVTLPRVRDFRGLNPAGVADGTLTIGFREHNVFPEIRTDDVERLHGLEATIVSTARDRRSGLAFFRALGFPFGEVAQLERQTQRRRRSPQ